METSGSKKDIKVVEHCKEAIYRIGAKIIDSGADIWYVQKLLNLVAGYVNLNQKYNTDETISNLLNQIACDIENYHYEKREK